MPTHRLELFVFVVFNAVAPTAQAENVPGEEHAESSSVELEYAPPQITYDEFRRAQLEQQARRTRNVLIGTSSSLVVGGAVFLGLFAHCLEVYVPEGAEPRCGRGAKAGLGISGIAFSAGFYGSIISGIMLAVRKGKLRRLDDRRGVSFDPERGAVVF